MKLTYALHHIFHQIVIMSSVFYHRCSLSLENGKTHFSKHCRPLSGFLSWLVPSAKIVKTEKNILFPEIQAFFDKGQL